MSIPKAAALLGLGHRAVRLIGVDRDFRMRTDALRAAIVADIERGLKPIAVVASAGTTATGSIDPIAATADVCAEYGLWLHVDGAYGALALTTLRRAKVGVSIWWTVVAVIIILAFNLILEQLWPSISAWLHFLILIAVGAISFGVTFCSAWLIAVLQRSVGRLTLVLPLDYLGTCRAQEVIRWASSW